MYSNVEEYLDQWGFTVGGATQHDKMDMETKWEKYVLALVTLMC